MRQIFLDRGDINLKLVALPSVHDYSVVVATHYSLVASHEEIELFLKNQPTMLDQIPRKVKKVLSSVIPQGFETIADTIKCRSKETYTSFGSSCAGRVIAIGSQVKTVRVGDWVACFGQEHAYHAEVVSVPEHCVAKLPDKKWLKMGALAGYGARAMHMVHGAGLMIGETVAVFIHDLFGLLVAQLCIKAGVRVIGIVSQEELQERAKQSGITTLFCASDETVITSLALLTGNHGVDATFIPSFHAGFAACDPVLITRKKGRVILGSSTDTTHMPLALHKELKYLFFSTYGAGTDEACYEKGCDYPVAHVRWTEQRNAQAFISCVTEGALDAALAPLLSAFPEYHIDDIGFKKPVSKYESPLALYITYSSSGEDGQQFTIKPAVKDVTPIVHTVWVPVQKSTLRVAIVGAPKLAHPLFVPYLASVRSARVVAVADDDSADALNLAHSCGAPHTYRTIDDLLTQELIDVIMVTSQYDRRASDVMRALSSGKAVYVEKPLATTMADLNRLEQLVAQQGILPLCVDHYRLYSPLIERIKEITDKRSGPLMLNYRMNVGMVSKEEFVQVDRGAGRIISDASHIMHLFCALTQAEPTTVSVEALHSIERNLFPTDNFMVIVGFSDGSLCQLTYTVLGHAGIGTERMELFVDGKSMILDDYTALYGFGTPAWFNTTLTHQDKGHKALLKAFFGSLKKETYEPVFSWKELSESTRLTLLVDQLACQGGGSKG